MDVAGIQDAAVKIQGPYRRRHAVRENGTANAAENVSVNAAGNASRSATVRAAMIPVLSRGSSRDRFPTDAAVTISK